MKKRWIAVFLGLFVLVAGIYYYFSSKSVKYETVTVERGDLVGEITEQGVFQPLIVMPKGSTVPGQISEIFVDFGDKVKAGDVLAKVESEIFKKRLEKAKGRLETLNSKIQEMDLEVNAATIKLKTATRVFEQNKILFEKQIISREDFSVSEDNLKSALNDLEIKEARFVSLRKEISEAETDLKIAELEFENTFIRSPIDGIVLKKSAEMGQTVSGAAFQVYSLFEICSPLEKLQFIASVNEVNRNLIYISQEIEIYVSNAIGTEIFVSTISEIRDKPNDQLLTKKVDYDAIVFVDNSELKLKPGMTGNYFIKNIVAAKDVFKVSSEKFAKAVTYAAKNDFADKILVLDSHGNTESRSIKQGRVFEGEMELVGEITEGEKIITGINNQDKVSRKAAPWGRRSQ